MNTKKNKKLLGIRRAKEKEDEQENKLLELIGLIKLIKLNYSFG